VAVVFAVGAALPQTRDAFRDARYHLDWQHALLTAFVLIPLGTVLFEEVAFRGVLWGLLRRAHGTATATRDRVILAFLLLFLTARRIRVSRREC